MIAWLLTQKIASLFFIMFMGFLAVRLKLLKAEQSKVLSTMVLYLLNPCLILMSFQVEYSPELQSGLLFSLYAAVIIHLAILLSSRPLSKLLKLQPVETASAYYSNALGLISPLVIGLFGKEWLIFATPFACVQLIFLWSHCKSIICEETKPDLKKMFANINMISALIGVVMFCLHIEFPAAIADAIDSAGTMVGPICMLVTGMLIGGMDLKAVFSYRRLPLVIFLRLIAMPMIVLLCFKFCPLGMDIPGRETVMLITLLAVSSCSASTITQMSLVYGKDANYASAINIATTLCCIATMPLLIAVFQL